MFNNAWKLANAAILALGAVSCTAQSKGPPGSAPVAGSPDQNPPPSTAPDQTDPCADPANTSDRCVPAYTGDHPIDRVLHPYLWKAHITPVDAGTGEICRRLFADLVGRFPSAAETEASCANKTIEQIAKSLQATDAYILLSERHWRDRLDTNDIVVDWRYLKSLYADVDALHRGTLKYGDFAERALVHPGFVMMEFEGPKIAQRVFRSFLGREATKTEADDLGALYRPWVPVQEADPDFEYLQTSRAYLLPYLCTSIAPCRSTLFGGLELDIPHSGTGELRWEDLDAIQLDALKDVSRLIVRQPYFWEAAADEILDRLLAWNDGGRFPRRPGVLLPEVRQVLADYIHQTGDYPGAERLVLTSLLYRQTAHVAPDGKGDDPNAPILPVWASGPVKPALAEVWLDSLGPLTWGDLGTCDPRYPDLFAYLLMYQAQMDKTISVARLANDMRMLHMLEGDRVRFGPDQSGLLIEGPSFTYQYTARMIGGCPGFQSPRQDASGLVFGYSQETIAEYACAPGAAINLLPQGTDLSVERLLTHQMNVVFGRDPTPEEVGAFSNASTQCSQDGCDPGSIANSICTGLLGSAEMLFY